jgi:hypothetical protein
VSEELRHEAEATLAAHQEVGKELEPQLVDQFADRVEQEIERRAQELARQRRPGTAHNAPMIPLALGSLGIAIPLMAIAGGIAGLAGIIAVCIAIVFVNVLWTARR